VFDWFEAVRAYIFLSATEMFYPRKGVLVYICVSYIFYTCNGDRLGKKM